MFPFLWVEVSSPSWLLFAGSFCSLSLCAFSYNEAMILFVNLVINFFVDCRKSVVNLFLDFV